MPRRDRRQRTGLSLLVLPALAGLLGLAACSSPRVAVEKVSLDAEPDANSHSPVAVDLVLVRDEKLVAELQKLTAADWFKRKAQYLRDHPDGLTVFDWEIVPDQHYAQTLPDHPSAWAGIVYANYLAAGDHRLSTKDKDVQLRFLDNDFIATTNK